MNRKQKNHNNVQFSNKFLHNFFDFFLGNMKTKKLKPFAKPPTPLTQTCKPLQIAHYTIK